MSEKGKMTNFFPAHPGRLEAVPWYANNEIYLREVRLSVPSSEWTEFLNSELFRELEQYVDSLETQDTHNDPREKIRISENGELKQNRTSRDIPVSFWALIRRWRHRMKRRRL